MFYVFILLTSFLVVTLSIPPLITIAVKKRLFDSPTENRKVHKRIIPNLGGIAIFTGLIFSTALFIDPADFPAANRLLASGLVLFIIGLKDDLIGLSPLKKFIAQFASALIITILADIRIANLQGFLGVEELNYPLSIFLTTGFIVGTVNAFNLIDGIDGLAGSLGLIMSIMYAVLFHQSGETGWSYLAIALAGSLIGFLVHNITPAKIFMGDCGSLLLGFIAAVLSIKWIGSVGNGAPPLFGQTQLLAAPALVLSILVVPVFDTLRVFTLRLFSNRSPFKADKNHIHHRLLLLGMSHLRATMYLAGVTVLFIGLALSLQHIGNNQLIGLITLLTLVSNTLFSFYLSRVAGTVFLKFEYEEDLPIPAPIPEIKLVSKKVIEKPLFQEISKN